MTAHPAHTRRSPGPLLLLGVLCAALGIGSSAGAADTRAAAPTPAHHKPKPTAKPAAQPDDGAAQHLAAGRFGTVSVYIPAGQAQERRDLPVRRWRLGAGRHQHGARA